MDLATPVGVFAGFLAIFVSMFMEGGNPAQLVGSPSALILVIVGTTGVSLASSRMSDMTAVRRAMLKMLKPGKREDHSETVEALVGFADTARKEGLLALEEKVKTVEDPFLKRGMQLVIDGSDAEVVQESLAAEISGLRARHSVATKFFSDMGGFSPTLGIIGTVLGLVHTLQNLSDPGRLGPLIASAFLATLWGVMLANVVYLPLANKMKRATSAEVAHMQLVAEGILAIQAGASPRVLSERLECTLPIAQRTGGKPTSISDKQAEKKSA
ncbi:MAG TPA: motility protein A [Mycobacteriales bacterium]|nr:motility protein A [Mycobacteriales bacterium]